MANHADYALTALCLWREDRGGGNSGMTAVACAIRNRVNRDNTSFFAEVVKRLQFSSMTATGDPELTLYPADNDPAWVQAQLIAENVIDGQTADITGGATLYYAPNSIKTTASIETPNGRIPFPQGWNPNVVTYTVTIGNQAFFTE